MTVPRVLLPATFLLVAGFLANCVGSTETPLVLPPNPPGCESLVQKYRDHPELAVDVRPEPRGMVFPPSRGYRNYRLEIKVIVDENGRPIPGTVGVSGARSVSDERELKEETLEWRFMPARVGECRVPAVFGYTISGTQMARSFVSEYADERMIEGKGIFLVWRQG